MNHRNSNQHADRLGLGSLGQLPTVTATEFGDWDRTTEDNPPQAVAPEPASGLFASEREYRFCLAVLHHPLQPSSAYPKLSGISPKLALTIRRQLVARGYLREHRLDSARGRSAIRLEVLPVGREAVNRYQPREDHRG